jgi:hypothetical protein
MFHKMTVKKGVLKVHRDSKNQMIDIKRFNQLSKQPIKVII